MPDAVVKINCNHIQDWTSFHDEFSRVLGFPNFYGRNMDAWIDCMTSIDAADAHMTEIHCSPGKVMTIELQHVRDFKNRCPEQYAAIVECTAFVNWRRIEKGGTAVLALSFKI